MRKERSFVLQMQQGLCRKQGPPGQGRVDDSSSRLRCDGRGVLMAALVLISVTRVKGESTMARTTSSDSIIPWEELVGVHVRDSTTTTRATSSSKMVPWEQLGGFLEQDESHRPTKTTVSASFEERVSRYRDEQSKVTPWATLGGGATSTLPPRDNDNDQQDVKFPPAENDFNSRLRERLQMIRKFLGPNRDHLVTDSIDDDFEGPLPLAYRYFGRKFARPASAGSIPIILLGPNADHWKVTGEQLQQQGFSVIACERVMPQQEHGRYVMPDTEENIQLVVNLLDALRWQNALLVACDNESLGAMQLALKLAPGRIAGLVLCGNLAAPTEFATGLVERSPGPFGLDAFLQQNLPCPFTIIWDGDTSEVEEVSSAPSDGNSAPDTETVQQHRSLILGGGTSPHRRRPEQMAWVITRFVEENLAQQTISRAPPTRQPQTQETQGQKKLQLPYGLGALFSQESFVVMGRILATGIAYGMAVKVGLYQYDCFRSGIFDFQTRLHDLLYTPEKVASAIVSVFRWIPGALGMLFSSKGEPVSQTDALSTPDPTKEETAAEEEESSTDDDGDTCDSNESIGPNRTDTEGEDNEQDEENTEGHGPPAEDHINYGPLFFLDKVIV